MFILRFLGCLLFCIVTYLDATQFEALQDHEKNQSFAVEYELASSFAGQADPSMARNCLKRALALGSNPQRSLEMQYKVLLTYFEERQFDALIGFFENNSILYADSSFAAYQDLLVLVYQSYEMTQKTEQADLVIQKIKDLGVDVSNKADLTKAVFRRSFDDVFKLSHHFGSKPAIDELTHQVVDHQKSNKVAMWLNAFIPGAGYLYLGQKKTSFISFTLNASLIAGAVRLFAKRHYALAALCTSVECGWYLGGVIGAKKSAYLYNERLFLEYADKIFYCENIALKDQLTYEF